MRARVASVIIENLHFILLVVTRLHCIISNTSLGLVASLSITYHTIEKTMPSEIRLLATVALLRSAHLSKRSNICSTGPIEVRLWLLIMSQYKQNCYKQVFI